MLHKNGAIPLYLQLENLLKESILTGEYKQNELIPSETELCKKFDINRGTVRNAIANLVDSGLIRKEHGRGSFVCLREVNSSIWNFGGFTDYLRKKNKIPVSRVLESKCIYLDGKKYFKLVRARGVKDDTIEFLTIDTSFISTRIFPNIDAFDFSNRSLYRTFREDYQIYPKIVEITVKPVISNAQCEKLFQMPTAAPILKVTGSVFNDSSLEIEKVDILYNPKVDFKLLAKVE